MGKHKRKFSELLYEAASDQLKDVDTRGVHNFYKRIAKKITSKEGERKIEVIDLTKNDEEKDGNVWEKPCYYGDYCSRWRQCTFSHGEPSEKTVCPFGSCNGIYKCFYKHDNEEELVESGKDPCIWGPWCYFTECKYWHPKRLVANLGVRYHDRWYDICQLCGLGLHMCQDTSPVVKSIHMVDRVYLYQCQAVEYGKQCGESVEGKYLCEKHRGWFG